MFSLILCSVFAASICRADYTVGVHAGDWIRYNVENHQTGAPATSYWVKISVVSVTGTVVSLRYESKILNETIDGQEDLASDCISVFAGARDLPYIIPANLSAGDSIPIYGFTSVTITDAVQRDGRDTVHYKSAATNQDYYWNRNTGALVGYTSTGESLTVNIADTSMWGGGGPLGSDSQIWIIIIVVLVIVGALFVLMLRRRKPPTTTLPPPSPAPSPPPSP